jgi:hypothetical protein
MKMQRNFCVCEMTLDPPAEHRATEGQENSPNERQILTSAEQYYFMLHCKKSALHYDSRHGARERAAGRTAGTGFARSRASRNDK